MEIFLPEEDPEIESELSPNLKDIIDKEDWKKIFEIITHNFSESENEGINKHKFSYLNNTLRSAKKEGLLTYSNRNLKNAIEKLIAISFLIPQSDSKYTLAVDYKENCEDYLKEAMNSMDDIP